MVSFVLSLARSIEEMETGEARERQIDRVESFAIWDSVSTLVATAAKRKTVTLVESTNRIGDVLEGRRGEAVEAEEGEAAVLRGSNETAGLG